MSVPLFDSSTPLAFLHDELRAAVSRVLDSERYILGPEVEAFESEFGAYCGAAHAVGVANGTEAITIALRAMGVGPGDEVVVPSFTFYASAEAIPATGATPVFCDVDPDTYCVTAETVRAALTPKTKAVIAVHLFGNIAPIAEIEALGVPVLEDAAQAAGSTAQAGRPGSLGTAATFSFFPSKNLGGFGDGGMITTRDAEIAERVRVLRFHGSQRQGDLRAGRLQLAPRRDPGGDPARPAAPPRPPRRRPPRGRARTTRRRGSASWSNCPCRSRAHRPPGISTSSPPSGSRRSKRRCAAADVGHKPYYRTPVHRQEAMRRWGSATPELPGTEQAARTHLAIPMSPVLTREMVEQVVAASASGGLAPALQQVLLARPRAPLSPAPPSRRLARARPS